MKVVDSKNKPVPYLTAKTHARLKHDYASWHPDHVSKVLKKKSPKLLYQDKSKFDGRLNLDTDLIVSDLCLLIEKTTVCVL